MLTPDADRFLERPTGARAKGSNNWVVAPSRSATADHAGQRSARERGVPSLRYIVGLTRPAER